MPSNIRALRAPAPALVAVLALGLIHRLSLAQGFDKINTTVTNVNAILVTISIAVVTISIIWAGFKMDPLARTHLAPAHGRAGGGHGPFPHGQGVGAGWGSSQPKQ